MGSVMKCCSIDNESESNILIDKNSELILPLNLSIQDILNIKQNPEYLEVNSGEFKDERNLKKNEYDTNFSIKCFKLRVYASYDEQMFPIWVEKGTRLRFKVSGLWSLYNDNKKVEVDSFGDHNQEERVLKNRIGCLLGRISGGPIFPINNNTEFIAQNKGCLFLLQNNGVYETHPKGFLNVSLVGGRIYSYSEIEKVGKWPYALLNTGNNFPELLFQEKDLIYLINKLRYDPSMFCDQYLNHLTEMNDHYDLCCQEIISFNKLRKIDMSNNSVYDTDNMRIDVNKTPTNDINYNNFGGVQPLKDTSNSSNYDQSSVLYKLNKIAKEFILIHDPRLQRISRERSERRQFVDTMDDNNKKDEENSLLDMLKSQNLNCSLYCEICTYGKSSAIGILAQLLIDDDHLNNNANRESLINGNYSHIGVFIHEHNIYEWSCSIILANLRETDELEDHHSGNKDSKNDNMNNYNAMEYNMKNENEIENENDNENENNNDNENENENDNEIENLNEPGIHDENL